MEIYYYIFTPVYDGGKTFEACSDTFTSYPNEIEITKEILRLKDSYIRVYDARVEKRYRLN